MISVSMYSYCAVVVPGELHFYKDAIAMNNNAVNSDLTSNNSGVVFEPVSLALAMSFKIVDKNKNKGSGYVNIDFGDNVVSLKFKTSSEAAKWKEGLLAWKEYAIDYQSLHGGSLAAGFASPSGQGAARSALSDHQALNQMKVSK